jgi:hypothetical protein
VNPNTGAELAWGVHGCARRACDGSASGGTGDDPGAGGGSGTAVDPGTGGYLGTEDKFAVVPSPAEFIMSARVTAESTNAIVDPGTESADSSV